MPRGICALVGGQVRSAHDLQFRDNIAIFLAKHCREGVLDRLDFCPRIVTAIGIEIEVDLDNERLLAITPFHFQFEIRPSHALDTLDEFSNHRFVLAHVILQIDCVGILVRKFEHTTSAFVPDILERLPRYMQSYAILRSSRMLSNDCSGRLRAAPCACLSMASMMSGQNGMGSA